MFEVVGCIVDHKKTVHLTSSYNNPRSEGTADCCPLANNGKNGKNGKTPVRTGYNYTSASGEPRWNISSVVRKMHIFNDLKILN